MVKYLLATVMVLAIAVPAAATIHEENAASPDISITLEIPCYTNVYWNPVGREDFGPDDGWDGDDHAITFNSTTQDGSNGGDWWRDPATGVDGGAYSANSGNAFPYNKDSQNAFAQGFYESYDGAFVWLESNCDVNLAITSGGDLETTGGDTLATWYTVALTNGENCTPTYDPLTESDCGFIDDGTRHRDCYIPGDDWGTFATESGGTLNFFPGTSLCYPTQHAFPMESGGSNTSYSGAFSAFCQGTILFHARVLRQGFADAAGVYTTDIDLGWTN